MQNTFINYVNNMTLSNQILKLQEIMKSEDKSLESIIEEDALLSEFKDSKEYLIKL